MLDQPVSLPVPEAKVNMDPNYEKQLRTLRDQAAAEFTAASEGGQVRWLRPLNWNGDGFDYQNMEIPFDRSAATAGCLKAISDPSAPGVRADVTAATTMIDYLATMERAFRSRMTLRGPRAVAHALGRRRGHGQDTGVLINCGVEYIRALLKQANA